MNFDSQLYDYSNELDSTYGNVTKMNNELHGNEQCFGDGVII